MWEPCSLKVEGNLTFYILFLVHSILLMDKQLPDH